MLSCVRDLSAVMLARTARTAVGGLMLGLAHLWRLGVQLWLLLGLD